jgi:serine/threonine-protein kinase ATR
MESYSRAYPYLVKLHMLQEIADVAGAPATTSKCLVAPLGVLRHLLPFLHRMHSFRHFFIFCAGSLERSEGPHERQRSLRWDERLRITQSSLASQEPVLALRRQLASLAGDGGGAGDCWLRLARLCRGTGHLDAATTAVLESVALRVPSAPLEQLRLLWDQGQPYRAVSGAQLLAKQAQERALPAPFPSDAEHAQFQAEVALQLAQWMAETGQGAKDDIEGAAAPYEGC